MGTIFEEFEHKLRGEGIDLAVKVIDLLCEGKGINEVAIETILTEAKVKF